MEAGGVGWMELVGEGGRLLSICVMNKSQQIGAAAKLILKENCDFFPPQDIDPFLDLQGQLWMSSLIGIGIWVG